MELGGWDLVAVMTGLLLFGIVYNAFVAWLERRGHDQGYTALLVVAGTLVTLLGAAVIIGLEDALVVLACFAASGLPMIVGSIARHVQERAKMWDEAKRILGVEDGQVAK